MGRKVEHDDCLCQSESDMALSTGLANISTTKKKTTQFH